MLKKIAEEIAEPGANMWWIISTIYFLLLAFCSVVWKADLWGSHKQISCPLASGFMRQETGGREDREAA